MVYKNNIPQANDFISISQRDIQGNFQDVKTIWGESPTDNSNNGDHIPLNFAEENQRGNHKKITLVEQNPIPVPIADEAILYSAEQNSKTELFYIRDGELAGNQITSNGALSVGGLVLRVYVIFDFNGNIIQRQELDEDGNVTLIDCSLNIASIIKSSPLESKWTINFTNALETDNYMWITQSFNNTTNGIPFFPPLGNAQPSNNAVYGSSVTNSSFVFINAGVPATGTTTQPGLGIGLRMLFQAYTVAQ